MRGWLDVCSRLRVSTSSKDCWNTFLWVTRWADCITINSMFSTWGRVSRLYMHTTNQKCTHTCTLKHTFMALKVSTVSICGTSFSSSPSHWAQSESVVESALSLLMSRYDSSSAISSGSLEQSLPTAAFRSCRMRGRWSSRPEGTKICSSSKPGIWTWAQAKKKKVHKWKIITTL